MEKAIQAISDMPQFSKDEFITSTAQYDFLYEYRDEVFVFELMVARMKEYAKEIGVKGFTNLWNSYLKTKQKSSGIRICNVTRFDGQALELASGAYTCDDFGVTKQGVYGETVICEHPIMPVERLVNIDTGGERLRIAFKKGGIWRDTITEKTTLASAASILQLAARGVLVNSENARGLSSFLLGIENLNYGDIPEQKSVGRLGWVGTHGFSPYVENLVFDGEQSFLHIFRSVKPCGDMEAWIQAMREVRAGGVAGRLMLAGSFASVLIDPCGLLPFFVHIWGSTEVGKTVGLMVAASVWASPKMGDYITTFNSTSVAQEMGASFLNSLPMCMDELQIQASQGARDFDKTIYALAEGVGKARGAKAGGLQKTTTWRNCFLTTGECPITSGSSGGGAVNRIIQYECTEPLHPNMPKLCDTIRENYGHGGKWFARWLQDESNMTLARGYQRVYYKGLLKFDSTMKQASAMSAILAADHIVTELLFEDGRSLTIDEVRDVLCSLSEVDVNRRAYEYALELVAQNPNKFTCTEYGNYVGEAWGVKEPGRVYIIKSVFDRALQNEGFNTTAFLSWAKRRGYIECDDERTTKRKTVNGACVRCICLRVKDEEMQSEIMTENDLCLE